MLPPILIIPAYNPDDKLLELVTELKKIHPEQECIVINDGSVPACDAIFTALEKQDITVLHHKVNRGKGEALKTGMRYFLAHFSSEAPGIVTADADGQHDIHDIIKISQKMALNPHALHLGVRTLSQRSIPLRSRIGNTLTRILFNGLTKNKINDTQTGLRGIPTFLIAEMIESKTSRYEFEFEMFFVAKLHGIPIIQTPIQTIYIDNNKSSHFNPLIDSLKIYYIFIRFCGVALVSFAVDFTLFCTIFYQSDDMGQAMLEARLVSATLNFFLNKNITFKADNNFLLAAAKFSLLALFIGLSSYQLLQLLCLTGLNVYASKILAEFLLFIASFTVQYSMIFFKRHVNI